MVYSPPCSYSIRLIDKLKSLDTKHLLDFNLINKAIHWAKKYHGDQKRKSGEPYYSHPLEVAYIISEYKLKTDVIAASILHDIVEDTEVTVEMLQDAFGQRIAEMVDRLTRDRPDGTKLTIEEIINNAYCKKDNEVLLIKLFDRFHNMQTVGVKSPEKVTKNVVETLKYFLSLAIFFEKQNYGIGELDHSINALCYQHINSKDKLNIRKSLVSNDYYLPDL
ncbi:MAG: HD domain-containing protein [Candidatus Megaira endosymbiont of Mesostigma viride]|jgi:(p)ppGpp synthase/HD superfamily hydrolase|nr:MAG: HD domain-containing protein [Candidatus Megaira endosymbiont of Mesostigma viride]HJK87910.1 HD domain-containing protein [Candidatus Megaira endosymbiont of Mesostigma viride]